MSRVWTHTTIKFLHEAKIAEMKTGEGKTLTIALAAYLNALHEKGVCVGDILELPLHVTNDLPKGFEF